MFKGQLIQKFLCFYLKKKKKKNLKFLKIFKKKFQKKKKIQIASARTGKTRQKKKYR